MEKYKDRKYMHLHMKLHSEFPDDEYMELDSERWQLKVISFFEDGKIAYAYDNVECNTFLAEAQYPEPDEVNGIEGYEGIHLEYITKEAFYNIWNKYVKDKFRKQINL